MIAVLFHIAIHLDELFQNRGVTASAFGGETGAIVKMAIYGVFMFVVRVRGAEQCLCKRDERGVSGSVSGWLTEHVGIEHTKCSMWYFFSVSNIREPLSSAHDERWY